MFDPTLFDVVCLLPSMPDAQDKIVPRGVLLSLTLPHPLHTVAKALKAVGKMGSL